MEKDFNKVIEFLKEFGNKDFLGFLAETKDKDINEQYLRIIYNTLENYDFKQSTFGVDEIYVLQFYKEIKKTTFDSNFETIIYEIIKWEMSEKITDISEVRFILKYLNNFDETKQNEFIGKLKEIYELDESIVAFNSEIVEFIGEGIDDLDELNSNMSTIKKLLLKGYDVDEIINYISINSSLGNE